MARRAAVLRGDRRAIPGAVRASCGLGTSSDDVDALLAAVRTVIPGGPPPVAYAQDPVTGDFWPGAGSRDGTTRPAIGAACARG